MLNLHCPEALSQAHEIANSAPGAYCACNFPGHRTNEGGNKSRKKSSKRSRFFSGEQRAEGGGRPDPGDEDYAGDWLPPPRGHYPGRLHGAR